MNSVLKLYQFPISHYCEKIRWTLDYKNINYETQNLLPGLHVLSTRKLSNRSAVPILTNGKQVVQGSSKIISYLDDKFNQRNLTPKPQFEKDEALAWEKYIDDEIGVHVRLCCYHILLENPSTVIPLLAHNGPWYGKLFLRLMFPKLKKDMRHFMKINSVSAKVSQQKLNLAINKLDQHYQQHEFLVGKKFSRADLSAAALLAPLCMPDQYGVSWPDNVPMPLQKLMDKFSKKISWVHKFYDIYR